MTLKDIARIANVNVSTVSKALRSSSDLNPQTIERIRKIAQEVNYKKIPAPEEKKSNRIGIVCPEITSMYYSSILHSLQLNFLKAGYQSIVMISNFNRRQEIECIRMLAEYNVCGIVFFSENNTDPSELQEIPGIKDLAFVIVAHNDSNDFCDNIYIDDYQGISTAIHYLAGLGHSRIAYIGDKLTGNRREAYEWAMQSESLPLVTEHIVENDLRFEECGYLGMKKLLTLPDPPTAIFAAYDNIAIGAMRAIYEGGYTIPGDFSVVGVDNLKTSSYLFKTLTTITEPVADLGELTCEMMIHRIHKDTAIRNTKLIPKLNIQETTGFARKK